MKIDQQSTRVFTPFQKGDLTWAFFVRVDLLERHALDLAEKFPSLVIETRFRDAAGTLVALSRQTLLVRTPGPAHAARS